VKLGGVRTSVAGQGGAELRGSSAEPGRYRAWKRRRRARGRQCGPLRPGAELLETRGDKRSGEIRDAAENRVPQQRPQRHEIPEFGDADPVSAGTALYESIQN
jgi:hypothetical protein